MSENIELVLLTSGEKTKDIEEYHEITHCANEQLIDGKILKKSLNVPNQYDFFSKVNVKTQKKRTKKKKGDKADQSNLMDIIKSEIQNSIVPISDAKIVKINNVKELYKSFLKCSSAKSIFRKSDISRQGFGFKKSITISPIFPRVLDNVVTKGEEIPVEYMEPKLFENLIAESPEKSDSSKFLNIEIRNIKFKHHHDFSLEKVLTHNLIKYFNEYESILKSLKDVSKEVRVNRETRENLKRDLLNVSSVRKDDIRFDQTLRKYTAKLLNSKDKLKGMLESERQIKHKIISVWSDIAMIRAKSKVTLTPYFVQVTTEFLEDSEFDNQWIDHFDLEFQDMLYKIEFEYINKYLEYKDAKNEQKLKGVEKKNIIKPKLQIDETTLRKDVEDIVNNLIKKEQIKLELKCDENLLTQSNLITIYEYHFKIYVDDVFVCESEHYSNTINNFDLEFTEVFSVQILSHNVNMDIVLIENDERVSQISIKLNDIKTSFVQSRFVTENFVYDRIEKVTAKRVGSGHSIKEIATANKVRLKSSNLFNDNFYSNCDVQLKLGWQQTTDTQSEALKKLEEVGCKLKRLISGKEAPNVDLLKDIINKIYDRDISNDEVLINTLSKLCKNKGRCDVSFPFVENNPEFVRFQLLNLRNGGGFSGLENKMVPIQVSEISTEQLNCLQTIKERNIDLQYLSEKQIEMDSIEVQRFIGVKYMLKLNKNMIRNLDDFLMRKTQKDVVREFCYTSLRDIFSKQKSQPVVNITNNSKRQTLKESLNTEQEIHINVMRAFNLKDRSCVDEDEDETGEKIAGFKVRPLRPFVRASYHGVSCQTGTAIGCHPTWNHTLKIKTELEPLSTLNINIYDECKVIIADGYSDDDDQHSRTVHYKYYNKWLGTVQIPLYTVLTLGFIKGMFKITTPPAIFGYEMNQNKENNSLVPEINDILKKEVAYLALNVTTSLFKFGGLQSYNLPLEEDYIIKHLNEYVSKYTNDYPHRCISLTFIDSSGKNKCCTQFLQPIPMPPKEFFPKNSNSCGSAMSKSSGLSKGSSSKSSGRKQAVDLERGEESPLKRSWADETVSKVINACLRYVALIPTYEITDTHVVTLMGKELLSVLYGSPLDHAILLASYFLHLGIKCWIVIGLGLPRGLSSYVLIQYDLTLHRFVQMSDQLFKSKGFFKSSEGYMWYLCDVVTGDRYELRDAGCPLKTVQYVFDDENIWVNVQSSQDIENVAFDLTRSADWEVVFDKSIFVMRNATVLENLYSAPPNVENLREILENKIKTKIQKWRPYMKTIWNRYCSGVLRDSLHNWEYWAFNQSESKPSPNQKLKQLMVTYKIFGFPLNMPFTNTKSVISAVRSTSLHCNDDPNVEFALGVEVYGYPNNVLSVWVFLASIYRT